MTYTGAGGSEGLRNIKYIHLLSIVKGRGMRNTLTYPSPGPGGRVRKKSFSTSLLVYACYCLSDVTIPFSRRDGGGR